MEAIQGLTGVKVLLEGPAGTGKTYALGTLVDWCAAQTPPIDVCVLFMERGLETLLGYWADPAPTPVNPAPKPRPVPANLYWCDLITKPVSLTQMKEMSGNVARLTYDGITKLSDGNRAANNPWEQMLIACTNFTDDRTGKKMGAVDSWGADRIFLVDSLSELSNAAMKMVIGSKPTASPGEYGIAQNNLMNWLRLCTQGCRCHFILTAHVSREKDEISGGIKLMTRAIGGAISGDIPPLFSEVIYTWREGPSFYWDTANASVDTKSRYLPIGSKIAPDFRQIMDKWMKRAAAGKSVPVIPA